MKPDLKFKRRMGAFTCVLGDVGNVITSPMEDIMWHNFGKHLLYEMIEAGIAILLLGISIGFVIGYWVAS